MKYLIKSAILFICLVNFIVCDEPIKSVLLLRYKSNATLDCAKHEPVEFYQEKLNGETVQLKADDKNVKIEGGVLTFNDVRADEINAEYFCKKGETVVQRFEKNVLPTLYKPDKPSVTVTEDGKAELKCVVLYGLEGGQNVTWTWRKNGTELSDNEKYTIVRSVNDTTLTILRVTELEKGEYSCEVKNQYGTHEEVIIIRVKDALAALWPFLAIVAEVIILCMIILIYENKCSKKSNTTDEDNEQNQNLMGNKDGNSELKKRTAKA